MINAPAHIFSLYQGVLPEQQCLYFFPLPHGHGSFRSAFIAYPVFVQKMRGKGQYTIRADNSMLYLPYDHLTGLLSRA